MIMTKSSVLFFLVFCSLFIGQASAGSYSVNGTTYDTTWDGRVIPSSQIVYGTNDDVILVRELTSVIAFTVGNDTVFINNNFTSFKREKFKISPVITFPKSLLASRMVNVNASVGYLVFPYSLSRVKDFISDNEIKLGNWTFRAGAEHINIYDDNQTTLNGTQNSLNKSAYTFRIANDEIRLYFLKSEANKLQGNISFEMNSWTINGSTSPAWQNSTLKNTSNNCGNIELDINPSNYISSWSGNGCVLDRNTTSVNGLTLNGGMGYTSDKSGFLFDGINDNAYVSTQSELNFTNGITIEAVINTTDVFSPTYQPIVSKRDDSTESTQSYHTDIRNGGKLHFGWKISSTWASSTTNNTVIQNNTEYKVKFTYNVSSAPVIYVNDVIVPSTFTGTLNNLPLSSYPVSIGSFIVSGSAYFKGTIRNIKLYNYPVTQNTSKYSSGYIKSWYNSTPNETYQIDVNGTWQLNSNTSLEYAQNGSSPSGNETPANVTANQSWILGVKHLHVDAYIWLFGNGTSTPSISNITLFDQAVSGETSCYPPITPSSLANSTSNPYTTFWINHTWSNGANTSSNNVSINGTWYNGSILTANNNSVGVLGWSNISVHAYNSTCGNLSNAVNMNTQALNWTYYNISGNITNTTGGNLSALVISSLGGSTTSNGTAIGNYTLSLHNGSQTITASLAGYTNNQTTINVNGADQIGIDLILTASGGLRNPFVAVGVAAMGVAGAIAIYNMYRRRGRPPMMIIPGMI